ncbi:MAG: TadE/TadG family type IV pilus assembly protein [Pseudolabrys sp.]
MMFAWKKLCHTLSAFRAARGGNVAITFAIATLPILGFVGAAVDYSRANSVKAAMQTALDSTALMLAKEAATDTEDQLKANALKYFTALFVRPEAKDIQVTVNYTTEGGSKIVVNATAQMPADFTKIIGYDNFNVIASSTSKWGTSRLRVALVLDNTGSMADAGKMAALQTATQGLLSQLQGAVTIPGDVYVSIVPFVKDVNVGAANYNADWIYWGTTTPTAIFPTPQDPTMSDNASWDALNGTCSPSSSQTNRNNCFTKGGTCSNSTYTTQSNCLSHGVCSVGGNTTQTTCNSNGTCSVAGQSTQSGCTSSGTCSNTNYTSQSACVNAGTCTIASKTSQSTCQNAHHCSVGNWSQSQCPSHGGSWIAGVWTSTPFTWTAGVWTPATFAAYVWTPGVWTPKNHSTWNGCVMDRGYPISPSYLVDSLGNHLSGPDATYNFDATAAGPDPVTPRWSSLYPAEQYGSCPQAVKALSYDWSGMNALVNAMSPAGNTNQAIGLQLGWMSLVGGGPFPTPPAKDPLYQYTEVIILLTDGLNTQDRWYTDQNSIDAREAITCDNIKAGNIVLYTIQVNTGGDPTSTLLQNCASSPDKFYLLTSAGQMTATFNEIGTNLTKLRVAQ